MRIIPQALLPSNRERNSEIAFKNYRAVTNMEKEKIQLTHHVLVFLTNGEKVIHTADKTITFGSSSIFLIKKGNYLMAERLIKTHSFYESKLFFFSNQQVQNFIIKYQLSKPRNLKEQKVIEITSKPNYQNWLKSFQANPEELSISFEVMELKLEELFLFFLQEEENTTNILFNMLEQKLQFDFIQLIDSKLSSPINLEELAFLSNMSLSTFKRKFKEELGVSAGTFIRKRKLEIAKNKIITAQAKGSDLYLELGYENHSSFITAFKKEYGFSPDEYRASAHKV